MRGTNKTGRAVRKPLDAGNATRMMMLKSVLQGKIDELVMMTKIGENVTMTEAENQLDEVLSMQPEEDLFLFLEYSERPVTPARAAQETSQSLITKVMECLDWAPLKEALGLGGGKGGQKGRRKSIFDDFVPQKQKDTERGIAPLADQQRRKLGRDYLQQCLAQGIKTVVQLAAKHGHNDGRSINARPPVPKPRAAVLDPKSRKRGRAVFRKKRQAGNDKIRDVYSTAVDTELSSTSSISLGRRLSAHPPPPGSRRSSEPPGSRSSRASSISSRGRRRTPPTQNTGERLKFERMLRGEKKARDFEEEKSALSEMLPPEQSSSEDDSEEDEFDEMPEMRAARERAEAADRAVFHRGRGRGQAQGRSRGQGVGKETAQEPEPEPEPEQEPELEPITPKTSKTTVTPQMSKASIASGQSTASTGSASRQHNPERVDARINDVFDTYLQLDDSPAAATRSTGTVGILGSPSQRFGPIRELYQTKAVSNVSPRAQATTPKLRHSPLGTTSEWAGHFDSDEQQRYGSEDKATRRRAPLPSAKKAPHVKTQHVWYRPYKRTAPYQSRWAVSGQYGMGAITGYDVAIPPSIGASGVARVQEVELDAEREAALAAAAQAETGSQSARAAPTDAAPTLPRISGAQSAR